jgi:hypothetical protein
MEMGVLVMAMAVPADRLTGEAEAEARARRRTTIGQLCRRAVATACRSSQ